MKNNGGLHSPSDLFLSQLKQMRETFQLMHRHSLIEGKNSIQQTVEKILFNSTVKNVPREVIWYFVKISVHFRIKYLNKNIRYEKKRARLCKNEERKKK